MAIQPLTMNMPRAEHRQRQCRTRTEATPETQPVISHFPAARQQEVQSARSTDPSAHSRSSRSTRHRITSYYNTFQTTCSTFSDPPPSYAVAARARPKATRRSTDGSEALPPYSCTVEAETKVLLYVESVTPLSPVGDGEAEGEGEWKEVYAVLRGTLLSLHRLKDGGAGRLLRTYTLQHAEVGLAVDTQHTVLVPRTRLAHLIPHSARSRAWKKDPHLFRPVTQTLLRVRAETDQILLAHSDEECIHSLICALGAAIDVAHPIDERSVPRQCTVPRRRRRPRTHFTGCLTDPDVIAEQERIMRQMYPAFACVLPPGHQPGDQAGFVQGTSRQTLAEGPLTPAREEEEIDFSMIREETALHSSSIDGAVRPTARRHATDTTINSVFSDDMLLATPDTNFDEHGKWRPPHPRTLAQEQRYIRRCMPVLGANASRASDIVMRHGRRMKVNWRMESLEEWELRPPPYKAHDFHAAVGLTGSATPDTPPSPSSVHGVHHDDDDDDDDDRIARGVERALDQLQLSKVASNATTSTTTTTITTAKCAAFDMAPSLAAAVVDPKAPSTPHLAPDMHGVVFCF